MKCPYCKTKVLMKSAHTSYSIDKHAWCENCGAYYSGGMNKSTREHYGSWQQASRLARGHKQ